MPRVQGGGTQYAGGPGTALRGPVYLKRWPGSANSNTQDFVQLFDANGQPTAGGIVVPSANIDPQVIQYLKVPLTSAQILALHGTPVALIAAPGAGKYIRLIDASLIFTFGTTQYSAGSEVDIKVGTVIVAKTTAAVVNAVAANAAVQLGFPGIGATQTDGPDNTALTITAAGSEFTTGDSPANVHLWYAIVTG